MPWLTPDSWLDRCGPLAAGLRAQYQERGGEEALAKALRSDPRRVIALVGAPGAGTSRMALRLARTAHLSYFPDPLAIAAPAADVAALTKLVAGVADNVSPLVVLDGPSIDDRLAYLAELVSQPIHPRLHVLVPCDHATARRLCRLAGGYPGRSILVAAVGGEPAPAQPSIEFDPSAALPFAVLGRCAAGRFSGQDTLVAGGVLARNNGDVVCLLDDRARATLAKSCLLDHPDGAVRLGRILQAEPDRHGAAVAALLRWTGETPPLGLLDVLLAFPAGEFPDPLDYWNLGIPLAPQVVEGLFERGLVLRDKTTDPSTKARLHRSIATLANMHGDDNTALSELRAGLELDLAPLARALLLSQLGGATQDTEIGARAVEAARHSSEYRALSRALRQQAALVKKVPDLAAAMVFCTEWIEVEAAHGNAASLAAGRSFALGLAVESDDHTMALSLAIDLLEARRTLGDVMGQLFAHYRYAAVLFATNDIDGAAKTIRVALALADHIGDAPGVGYCHWLLGSIADRQADPEVADEHYSVAIDAYGANGQVPPRLLARQRLASIAADGMRRQAAQGGGAAPEEEPMEMPTLPDPQRAPNLVELLVRRKKNDGQ